MVRSVLYREGRLCIFVRATHVFSVSPRCRLVCGELWAWPSEQGLSKKVSWAARGFRFPPDSSAAFTR